MVDGAADGFFTEGNEVNEDGTGSGMRTCFAPTKS